MLSSSQLFNLKKLKSSECYKIESAFFNKNIDQVCEQKITLKNSFIIINF